MMEGYKYAVTIDVNYVYLEDNDDIVDVDNILSTYFRGSNGEPLLFDSLEDAEVLAEETANQQVKGE